MEHISILLGLMMFFGAAVNAFSNEIVADPETNSGEKSLPYIQIKDIPRVSGYVSIVDEEITEFPEYYCYLSNVKSIVIRNTKIYSLPKCLENHFNTVRNIEIVSNDSLATLHFDIGVFQNLIKLNIHGNKNLFKKVLSIPSLPLLEKLDLSYNGIGSSTAYHLGKWPKLEELELSGNSIGGQLSRGWIISGSPMLKMLTMEEMGISEVPASLPFFPKLEGLVLTNHNLKGPAKARINKLFEGVGTRIVY